MRDEGMTARSDNDPNRAPPASAPADSVRHGTEWAARRCTSGPGGKACDDCRHARNDAQAYRRLARTAKDIPAGLKHGRYVHEEYGCECDICMRRTRKDNAKRQRDYRARRKEAS